MRNRRAKAEDDPSREGPECPEKMSVIRVVVLHPSKMSVPGSLNLHGVQQLVEQEGLPLVVCEARDLERRELRAGDVLVVAENECLDTEEEGAIVAAAKDRPLVWCGLPRENASPALLKLLGVERLQYKRNGDLCRLLLSEHPICAPFTQEHETHLKMKHVPHLIAEGSKFQGEEILTIELMDGNRLGPGVLAIDGKPRRVVWTFPLGYFFAVANCRHIEIRYDADWLDWPLMTYLDVLRGVLRESLRWAAPESSLVRKYYWPVREGGRPAGVVALSHDLCGYSKEGVKIICEICAKYGVQTTFFDMPPIRLSKGEVGDNVIALHIYGGAQMDEIIAGVRALEERHGRKILGWRRHGDTEVEHYPQIWRNIEKAGLKWADTFPAQSHPNRARCSPCGRANRLPFDIMDLETGRRMELLDLAMFDTDDADRLSAVQYGMRLPWDQFKDMVERRLDFAAKHHLIAGYLLHGWTAGVKEETGRFYGAHDALRMLSHIIEAGRARGMVCMGGDELYRWWVFRRQTQIEIRGGQASVIAPSDEFSLQLETLAPLAR